MAAADDVTRAARSRFVPRCAAATAWVCLLLGACLNPMPEEFPSHEGRGASDPSAQGSAGTSPNSGPELGAAGSTGSSSGDNAGGVDYDAESPAEPGDPPTAPSPGGSPDAGVDEGADAGGLSDASGSEGDELP